MKPVLPRCERSAEFIPRSFGRLPIRRNKFRAPIQISRRIQRPAARLSKLDQPAIERFAGLGWQSVGAFDEVFGTGGTLGRESPGEVVLLRYLVPALEKPPAEMAARLRLRIPDTESCPKPCHDGRIQSTDEIIEARYLLERSSLMPHGGTGWAGLRTGRTSGGWVFDGYLMAEQETTDRNVVKALQTPEKEGWRVVDGRWMGGGFTSSLSPQNSLDKMTPNQTGFVKSSARQNEAARRERLDLQGFAFDPNEDESSLVCSLNWAIAGA